LSGLFAVPQNLIRPITRHRHKIAWQGKWTAKPRKTGSNRKTKTPKNGKRLRIHKMPWQDGHRARPAESNLRAG